MIALVYFAPATGTYEIVGFSSYVISALNGTRLPR